MGIVCICVAAHKCTGEHVCAHNFWHVLPLWFIAPISQTKFRKEIIVCVFACACGAWKIEIKQVHSCVFPLDGDRVAVVAAALLTFSGINKDHIIWMNAQLWPLRRFLSLHIFDASHRRWRQNFFREQCRSGRGKKTQPKWIKFRPRKIEEKNEGKESSRFIFFLYLDDFRRSCMRRHLDRRQPEDKIEPHTRVSHIGLLNDVREELLGYKRKFMTSFHFTFDGLACMHACKVIRENFEFFPLAALRSVVLLYPE